jgi:two-component system, NarL family, nitrate/nitrite response regulator NarL
MIRVLIVEEVRAICETIAAVLRAEADMDVVGCATNLDEALPSLRACDVALVNTTGNSEASASTIRAVHKLAPRVKVVVMGLARSQNAILQCVEAGVAGYVLRDSSLADLIKNIRAAYNNEALVSPPIAAALMSYVAELVGFDPAAASEQGMSKTLTRREREVLTLVQQGLTNQEIAGSLVIELGTVKNHVHNILRKLNVNSRRDAVHVSRLAGLWGTPEARSKPVAARPAERAVYSSSIGATT